MGRPRPILSPVKKNDWGEILACYTGMEEFIEHKHVDNNTFVADSLCQTKLFVYCLFLLLISESVLVIIFL